MPLLDRIAIFLADACAAAAIWPVAPAGAATATGIGMASVLALVWQLARGLRRASGDGDAQAERETPAAAQATPGLADRLKARFGTGYPAFSTLDQIDKIMAERTQHFFGRDDQLAALAAFVKDKERGILVLAAPGGFGKSALLANWGRRREAEGAAVAYHFFNATAGRTTQRADALKGLLVQLAFLRGRPEAPDLPDNPARLEDLLTQELCRDASPEAPLIVILDGLDEAAERVPPLAPAGLGRHVYVLVSGRAEPTQRPEYLALWLLEAGRVGYPIHRHDMPELRVDGVLQWVRGIVPGLPGTQETRLAQRLAATGEGVPLFLQFIVDDIRDRRQRGEAPAAIIDSLEALPAPFTAYAEQQLHVMREIEQKSPDTHDVARVFALLTLIKGSLPLAELRAVLDTKASPWDFDPRIRRWFTSRGAGTDRAIAFLHPRLADVFRKTLSETDTTADTLAEVRDRLIGYCKESWRNGSQEGSRRGSLYALTNLPLHQIEAGRIADAIATLSDLAFLDARLAHSGGADADRPHHAGPGGRRHRRLPRPARRDPHTPVLLGHGGAAPAGSGARPAGCLRGGSPAPDSA